jgi:hypothetical protein
MILNVDERKMEHDDPKATTTKGHDTRTHLNHQRGRPTDTGQNLNHQDCTDITAV